MPLKPIHMYTTKESFKAACEATFKELKAEILSLRKLLINGEPYADKFAAFKTKITELLKTIKVLKSNNMICDPLNGGNQHLFDALDEDWQEVEAADEPFLVMLTLDNFAITLEHLHYLPKYFFRIPNARAFLDSFREKIREINHKTTADILLNDEKIYVNFEGTKGMTLAKALDEFYEQKQNPTITRTEFHEQLRDRMPFINTFTQLLNPLKHSITMELTDEDFDDIYSDPKTNSKWEYIDVIVAAIQQADRPFTIKSFRHQGGDIWNLAILLRALSEKPINKLELELVSVEVLQELAAKIAQGQLTELSFNAILLSGDTYEESKDSSEKGNLPAAFFAALSLPQCSLKTLDLTACINLTKADVGRLLDTIINDNKSLINVRLSEEQRQLFPLRHQQMMDKFWSNWRGATSVGMASTSAANPLPKICV